MLQEGLLLQRTGSPSPIPPPKPSVIKTTRPLPLKQPKTKQTKSKTTAKKVGYVPDPLRKAATKGGLFIVEDHILFGPMTYQEHLDNEEYMWNIGPDDEDDDEN